MAPFITETSCLKCHAFQGYKAGDVRGGVSVTTDISNIIAGDRKVEGASAAGHLALWIISMLIMLFGYKSFTKMLEKLHANQEALKKTVDEKSTLFSELNHRVKNNLQIISGILSLQADSAENAKEPPAEILKNAQARVMSMALIHDCMYKSKSIADTDMNLYFDNLVNYYKSTFDSVKNITYKKDIENINISLTRIITCGLIINELVTNSIKHAFNGIDNPEISIRLKVDGDNVVLAVKDNGRGFPDDFSDGTLGMLLVKSLTEQLYGNLEMKNDNGAICTITFPLFV